jgi:hypothetical protein
MEDGRVRISCTLCNTLLKSDLTSSFFEFRKTSTSKDFGPEAIVVMPAFMNGTIQLDNQSMLVAVKVRYEE